MQSRSSQTSQAWKTVLVCTLGWMLIDGVWKATWKVYSRSIWVATWHCAGVSCAPLVCTKIPQHRAGEEMPASYSGGRMGASLRCVETATGINIPQSWALYDELNKKQAVAAVKRHVQRRWAGMHLSRKQMWCCGNDRKQMLCKVDVYCTNSAQWEHSYQTCPLLFVRCSCSDEHFCLLFFSFYFFKLFLVFFFFYLQGML